MWLSTGADALDKFTKRASQVTNAVGVPFLAGMMFLTAADVILRYLFNRPIGSALELTELMLVVIVFCGLAYTAVHKGHVAVDVVVSRFPPRAQAVIGSITCLLSLGIFSLIVRQSIVNAFWYKEKHIETAILGVPVPPFLLLVALGAALLCLVLLGDFLNYLVQGARQYRVVWLRLLPAGILLLLSSSAIVWLEELPQLSPAIAGIIGIGFLFLLLLCRMPVAFVLALIGFLGMTYLRGIDAGFSALGEAPFRVTADFPFSVIPLFVLMGFFTFVAGMSEDLYRSAYRWLGQLPGGLAMATVAACGAFAAICGTSTAGAVTMGTIALPEMERYKYHPALATGCIAAGGTVGVLIPPSIAFIIYALLTNESIGKLFIAGILPGVMSVGLYIITIYVLTRINPNIGPPGPRTNFIEKLVSLKVVWPALLLFVLVIGGIYGGIFTPTEGGGIGAFGAFIIALGMRRLTWQKFVSALVETGKVTAMIFLILIGANIFSYFLAASKLPFFMAEFIAGLPLPPIFILLAILFVWLILGALMPAIPMIILTVPIFFPTVLALGFDPIWFGVLTVMMLEIAVITPPIGINVFVLSGVARHIPMATIFRGILPFLGADATRVALVVAFPQIALFLPYLLR